MNDKKLKVLIIESISQVIAQEVVERLALLQNPKTEVVVNCHGDFEGVRNKRVLVVFTGSGISVHEAVGQVAVLKNYGVYTDLYFSHGARMIMDIDDIIETVSPDGVLESEDFLPEEICKKYDCIVLPTMTINTVAKMANCICDSYVTRLVMNGVFSDIPVVAAIDGCCPKNEGRKAMGHSFNEFLSEKLSNNLETIKGFGVRLTTCENLCRNVLRRLRNRELMPLKSIEKNKRKNISGRIIGESIIKKNVEYNTLVLEKGAMLTQLAREAAQRFNIEIVYER